MSPYDRSSMRIDLTASRVVAAIPRTCRLSGHVGRPRAQ